MKDKGLIRAFCNQNYLSLNRDVIKLLGLNMAGFLSELCNEYKYYEENNLLAEDEWFYSTVENIKENIGLTREQQDTCIKKLKALDIIDVKVKGTPPKRYFKININVLLHLCKTHKSICVKRTNRNVEKTQIHIDRKSNKEKAIIKNIADSSESASFSSEEDFEEENRTPIPTPILGENGVEENSNILEFPVYEKETADDILARSYRRALEGIEKNKEEELERRKKQYANLSKIPNSSTCAKNALVQDPYPENFNLLWRNEVQSLYRKINRDPGSKQRALKQYQKLLRQGFSHDNIQNAIFSCLTAFKLVQKKQVGWFTIAEIHNFLNSNDDTDKKRWLYWFKQYQKIEEARKQEKQKIINEQRC